MPRLRVWSRGIVEGLERGQIAEALEAGSIVVANEAEQEGVPLGMRCEEAVCDTAFGLTSDRLDDATVEALDEPVGLWMEGFCESMSDAVIGADAVEGMTT